MKSLLFSFIVSVFIMAGSPSFGAGPGDMGFNPPSYCGNYVTTSILNSLVAESNVRTLNSTETYWLNFLTNFVVDCPTTTTCPPIDEGSDFDKVAICHRPPGKVENEHTIEVGSQQAVDTHLAHGDHLGACIGNNE